MTKDLTVLEMCPPSSVLIYRDVRRSTVQVTVNVSLVSVNVKDTGQEVDVISWSVAITVAVREHVLQVKWCVYNVHDCIEE